MRNLPLRKQVIILSVSGVIMCCAIIVLSVNLCIPSLPGEEEFRSVMRVYALNNNISVGIKFNSSQILVSNGER